MSVFFRAHEERECMGGIGLKPLKADETVESSTFHTMSWTILTDILPVDIPTLDENYRITDAVLYAFGEGAK